MRAILAATAAALLLSACSYIEGPHPWPNERRLLAKDWVIPQVEAEQIPVYCYRTLGAVECHNAPLATEHGRFVSTDAGIVEPPEAEDD